MLSVDVGSVVSQRKIHIIFKMYSNKTVYFHTVASIDLSIQSDCTQKPNVVTSNPNPLFKLLPYIHHVLYRYLDRNKHQVYFYHYLCFCVFFYCVMFFVNVCCILSPVTCVCILCSSCCWSLGCWISKLTFSRLMTYIYIYIYVPHR